MRIRKLSCPCCDFVCVRAKQFESHLAEHGLPSVQLAYITHVLSGIVPTCRCGCGEVTKFTGWRTGFAGYRRGHNALLSSLPPAEAQEIRQRRLDTFRENGHTGWSRGLTKETSQTLAAAAEKCSRTIREQFSSGDRHAVSKGQTKATSHSVARMSATLRERFSSGELSPWSKGKNKDNDERVRQMSLAVTRTMNEKNVRDRLDSLTRLTGEEIRRRTKEHCSQLTLLSDVSEYTRDRHTNLLFSCNRCGLQQKKSLLQAMTNRCDTCDPFGSSAQVEMLNVIRGWGLQVESCNRKTIPPYEIGILCQQQKLGIEYNGLYFHSAQFKHRTYHSDKSTACSTVGYQLVHVFEDEWRDRRLIVESMLRSKLGVLPNKLSARDCHVVKLSKKEREEFFERTHMDGDARASVSYGLMHKDGKLVAAMSLRFPAHKKYREQNLLEIARFSCELDISVRGAFSKLLKACEGQVAENGHAGLLSYVDTRNDNGMSYLKTGFQKIGITANRFWWTDGKNRLDRFAIRADKEAGMTEQQVADECGSIKIWGTPNLIFVKLLR